MYFICENCKGKGWHDYEYIIDACKDCEGTGIAGLTGEKNNDKN